MTAALDLFTAISPVRGCQLCVCVFSPCYCLCLFCCVFFSTSLYCAFVWCRELHLLQLILDGIFRYRANSNYVKSSHLHRTMTLTSGGEKCPGLYCGIQTVYFANGTSAYTECGACPRGYRVDSDTSLCSPCITQPTTYDWLYLGFMAMLPLILHWFFIDLAAKERWYVALLSVEHRSFLAL